MGNELILRDCKIAPLVGEAANEIKNTLEPLRLGGLYTSWTNSLCIISLAFAPIGLWDRMADVESVTCPEATRG